MSQKFKSELELEALNNASTDTDKFLVSDNGIIKYRTGIELLNDINGQSLLTNPITGTGTTNRISKFTAGGTIGDSQIFDDGTNVGIGTTTPQARLDVKAQGVLATDIAFRVRNSTDTQNFLVVNGAGDVYNNGAGGVNSNTFFGEYVGRNTTGNNNSAFGIFSLTSNTTGSYNSAFGILSLASNTTGNNNSAFGLESLKSNTTGSYNSAFGFEAGKYTNSGGNNETSNNSVYIGFNTRANANNETNQIVIGHSARGDGSNSVVLGNSSITRTRLQGQVIIGTFATPPTGIEGAIYYDSSKKKHYGFDGINWNPLY